MRTVHHSKHRSSSLLEAQIKLETPQTLFNGDAQSPTADDGRANGRLRISGSNRTVCIAQYLNPNSQTSSKS